MKVDLPRLAQRVGLDVMALIVDVETVLGCVLFQVGDETCDVDGH
jgi:hypothetical protein